VSRQLFRRGTSTDPFLCSCFFCSAKEDEELGLVGRRWIMVRVGPGSRSPTQGLLKGNPGKCTMKSAQGQHASSVDGRSSMRASLLSEAKMTCCEGLGQSSIRVESAKRQHVSSVNRRSSAPDSLH
jgi:hypothetical protein